MRNLLFVICSMVAVSGCGDSSDSTATTGSPAYDTATAVTAGMINATDQTDEMKQLTLQQPEIKSVNLCVAKQLELQGWSREQHDFFMGETNNTGNLALINSRKFSEAEQLKHFGPLFTATGSCM